MKQNNSALHTWISRLSAHLRGSAEAPDPDAELMLDLEETEDYRSGEFLNSLFEPVLFQMGSGSFDAHGFSVLLGERFNIDASRPLKREDIS